LSRSSKGSVQAWSFCAASEEDRIEIAGGPSVKMQAQFHRDTTLDDEHGLAGGSRAHREAR
jgi:hypothetical protein